MDAIVRPIKIFVMAQASPWGSDDTKHDGWSGERGEAMISGMDIGCCWQRLRCSLLAATTKRKWGGRMRGTRRRTSSVLLNRRGGR
jgi:hypothetical protein